MLRQSTRQGDASAGVHRCVFEPMEDRKLMSSGVTAWLAQGSLCIRGTEYNDRIVVRQVANRLSVDGIRGSVASSAVRNILVDARGGNDTVVMMNPVLAAGTQYIYQPSVISGGSGHDLISGGAGTDLIFGDAGNDAIYGTWGNDLLVGGFGNDVIYAGTGNDRLAGADGNDTLYAGDGNDWMDGGSGYDMLSGGTGVNTLLDDYGGAYRVGTSGGHDYVQARAPLATMPSSFVNTPLMNLRALAPAGYSTTGGIFQSMLPPDLYDAIVVRGVVPNFWHAGN